MFTQKSQSKALHVSRRVGSGVHVSRQHIKNSNLLISRSKATLNEATRILPVKYNYHVQKKISGFAYAK